METYNVITRQQLLAREWIQEPPIVQRFHNRHRKDVKLTEEQVTALRTPKEKGGEGIDANGETEQKILRVLRKKYKRYIFTETMFFKCD